MIVDDEYTGPERRSRSRSVDEVEQAFEHKLRDHEKREEERMQALIGALITAAFPDGAEKHRDYHQAKINSAREEAEFWRTAKLELTKVGVSALVGVVKTVLVLALVGFLYKIGLGAFAASIVK